MTTTVELPVEKTLADGEPAGEPAGERARRAWSGRGLLAAVTALVVGAVVGTAGTIAVIARVDRAPQWTYEVFDDITTRQWDDRWVLGSGIGAAVLGLWLLLLALTPGRRSLLPLRAPVPGMTAYMTRRTAAGLLRHTVLASPGVLDARVRMGRRKATVRVDYHFRDVDELFDELETSLRARSQDLLLVRVPRIDLQLQPVSSR